ncbi:MAG: 30S ribosome-binding factor RbfA [Alphaproteobacteria bacterium]|nr:30S ribosome-binding factor RbfA [Alphaproteobacteria bacterium]
MKFDTNPASNRQLKVGETIKRSLSEIITNKIYETFLDGKSVIISEVKMTPDLRLANVYIYFLFDETIVEDVFLESMQSIVPKLKGLLAKKVKLRYMPDIKFILDESFNEASKIDKLLKD